MVQSPLASGAGAQAASQPTIAVDIDEVLCPFVPVLAAWHNSKYGTSLTAADFHSYTFYEVWGGDAASSADKIAAFFASPAFGSLTPLPGAVEAISSLAPRARLVVVTARSTAVEPITRAFLEAHFPGFFSDVFFGSHWAPSGHAGRVERKIDLCRRAGAALLIDDNRGYANECSEAGVPALLFGDYAWNKGATGLHVTRVADWSAALAEVHARLEDGTMSQSAPDSV